MNISVVTHIITLVVGAGIGALACSKYFKSKYEVLADEEIASVKAKLQNMNSENGRIRRVYQTMDNRPDPADIARRAEKFSRSYDVDTETIAKIAAAAQEPKEDEDITQDLSDDQNDEDAVEETHLEPRKDPYFITEDEYYKDNAFDKEVLVYYEDDEVLSDSREEMIDDVYHTVGDAIEEFERSGEEFLYVRNERLGMDFEIQRVEGSYQEAVYGYVPPSGRNTKKARERAKNE